MVTRKFAVAALTGLSLAVLAVGPAAAQFRSTPGGAAPGTGVTPAGVAPFGTLTPATAGGPYNNLLVTPQNVFDPTRGATLTSLPGYSDRDRDSYYPGYPIISYPDPFGGYLRGQADVINAQGRFMIDNQAALLMKQNVKQAKVDTRRKVFDEWLYERANTPTLQDELERLQRDNLRRSLNDPPVNEIWSSKALNDLLKDLQKLPANYQGPPVSVDEEQLKKINVTVVKGEGNIALIKNEGRLAWPIGLITQDTEELRRNIDVWVIEAKKQANNGQVDRALLKQFTDAVRTLQNMTSKKVNDMPFDQYTDAKRFLSDLAAALKILERPDAANYINGKYSLRGKTVGEVVSFMTNSGLEFAPAVKGEEGAYTAMHQWLVYYHSATRSLTTDK